MPSAETPPIVLEVPGDPGTLRLVHDPGGQPAWRLEGEIDWATVDGLRLILAAFEDGRALALAALRPTGATGHDRDSVAVQLTESGDPVPLTEALVSTEYDAEGLPRRVGAELWAEPDSPPMRLAGDRHGEVKVDAGEPRREAVRMSFRLEGVGGVGTYELLRGA